MLQLLDIGYTLVHLLVIGFNMLGWIWPKTRILHLWSVGITLFCWLIIGAWYGFGYCPLTDWHWQVKEQLGERDLPASFITYLLNNVFGVGINEQLSDFLTVVFFALAILAGVCLKFFRKTKSHTNNSSPCPDSHRDCFRVFYLDAETTPGQIWDNMPRRPDY